MVNDDAKVHYAIPAANAGMNEVKDWVDELEESGKAHQNPFFH